MLCVELPTYICMLCELNCVRIYVLNPLYMPHVSCCCVYFLYLAAVTGSTLTPSSLAGTLHQTLRKTDRGGATSSVGSLSTQPCQSITFTCRTCHIMPCTYTCCMYALTQLYIAVGSVDQQPSSVEKYCS